MVKRYQMSGYAGNDSEGLILAKGEWVKHSDYLSLQSALKEALDGWARIRSAASSHLGHAGILLPLEACLHDDKRISELRSQFLKDVTDK